MKLYQERGIRTMTKYAYPAVFTPEENGAYSVNFPDLESCYTCGDNLTDSIMMAEDVLAFVLYGYERDEKIVPVPSNIETFHLQPGEFVNYIACDTLAYRKMHSNRSVKKTLSIPEWLNEAAERAGINFSGVLQDALMKQLNLN